MKSMNMNDNNKKEDVVKQPRHYKNGLYETLDEMLIVFGPVPTYDFCRLNAWKYRARAPFKGKQKEDMDKANRYIEYAHMIQNKYPNCFENTTLLFYKGSEEDDIVDSR